MVARNGADPRLRHRPPSHGRRHAGRRRRRHGDARRRAGPRHRPRVAAGRSAPAPADEPARQAADAGARARACGRAGRVIRLRPLRGRRRARDCRAGSRGGLDRRFHPVRRRAGGAGAARRRRAAAARRHGQCALGRRGELRERPAGASALHAAAGVRGHADPGGAGVRRSRQDRGVAAGGGRDG